MDLVVGLVVGLLVVLMVDLWVFVGWCVWCSGGRDHRLLGFLFFFFFWGYLVDFLWFL